MQPIHKNTYAILSLSPGSPIELSTYHSPELLTGRQATHLPTESTSLSLSSLTITAHL